MKLSINQWAEEDRPREKMMRLGAAALTNAELLAILIGSGSQDESAVDLTKRVLADCGNNLNTLGKKTIAELTDDYTAHTGRYVRVAPGGQNEAPALMKRNGTYWMITSGCTGWAPNKARMFKAESIWGPWEQLPNPCVGPNADLTFGGQSTYIQQLGDEYMFMADIWRPEHPSDARYIWLPITFKADGTPVVEWQDSWSPKAMLEKVKK